MVRPRPDATMALVDELLLRRGEDAYASAALQRDAAHPDALLHDLRVRVPLALAGLLVAGLVLGVALAQQRELAPAADADRAGLVEAVQQRQRTVAAAEDEAARLRAAVVTAGAAPTTAPAPSPDPSLLAAVGLAPVSGSGVEVVIEDPPADDPVLSFEVEDRDLQIVVNALWAAGATAVAVDGRRLAPTTAIREAGGVVLVGYRAVTSPYSVQAIGPAGLGAAFGRGAGGVLVQGLAEAYGVTWSVEARRSLELPAAEVSLRYAERAG